MWLLCDTCRHAASLSCPPHATTHLTCLDPLVPCPCPSSSPSHRPSGGEVQQAHRQGDSAARGGVQAPAGPHGGAAAGGAIRGGGAVRRNVRSRWAAGRAGCGCRAAAPAHVPLCTACLRLRVPMLCYAQQVACCGSVVLPAWRGGATLMPAAWHHVQPTCATSTCRAPPPAFPGLTYGLASDETHAPQCAAHMCPLTCHPTPLQA